MVEPGEGGGPRIIRCPVISQCSRSAIVGIRIRVILDGLRNLADSRSRNNIVRKRLPTRRIGELLPNSTAEIAPLPRRQRHALNQRNGGAFARAFVIGEEEKFVLLDGAAREN